MSLSSRAKNSRDRPSWVPGETFSISGSYLAPGMFQQHSQHDDLTKAKLLSSKVLRDPLLLSKLCDRVYELMLEDISRQKERIDNYGRLY